MAKKRTKHTKEIIDTGTDAIHKRHTVVPKLTRGMNGFNMKVMDETEIDRLLLLERISVNQHNTLERFLVKLQKVGMAAVRSPDYSSPIHADATAIGDKRAIAIKGITKLIEDLDKAMGNTRRMALVALVLEDREWPASTDLLHESIGILDRIMG